MNQVFPSGLPPSTIIYLALYLGTLAVHVLFLSYVLAGTGYLATTALLGRPDPASHALRDWLPFALGATITAGVAPLLFVQILYRESFYTANLLLAHRWMAMVPVLLVGFYLLYFAKSKRSAQASAWVPRVTAFVALSCFVFVAYLWTKNHSVSLDRAAWAAAYVGGHAGERAGPLFARFCVWVFGAVPIMATAVAWQVRKNIEAQQGLSRRLGVLSAAALIGACLCAVLYARSLAGPVRAHLWGPVSRPYLVTLGVGAVLQISGWLWHYRTGDLREKALVACTAGVVMTVLSACVLREIIRLGQMDTDRLAVLHDRSRHAGGMAVFAILFAVNLGVITWCVRAVRRHLDRGLRQTRQN